MASNKKDKTGTEKKSWYNDRYEAVVVQRNFAAVISLAALLLSVISAFAISQLAPLKSVEPFVIEVDQKTGITQVADQVRVKELSANDAVNQYFVVQYVRARESFMGTQDVRGNYYNSNIVRVLSAPEIYTNTYLKQIALSNTESPAARLGSGGMRDVQVQSVKLLEGMDKRKKKDSDDTIVYLVKARIVERTRAAPNDKVMQKLIFVEFKYLDLELTMEDRFHNPLGFQVTTYRVDDESVAQ